jgi:hypothetical protein
MHTDNQMDLSMITRTVREGAAVLTCELHPGWASEWCNVSGRAVFASVVARAVDHVRLEHGEAPKVFRTTDRSHALHVEDRQPRPWCAQCVASSGTSDHVR